jgi:3-hydroxyisobutyrate dehydrogenase-like beta-hydroxyacid dehydrogenase
MRLGVIGAGRMGGPMVRRLAAAGHEVRALGRSPQIRAELALLGAHPVTDVADVAADADSVLVCVFSDQQVADVCLHSGLLLRMQPGAVLVIHTTASPRTVQAIAARAGGRGIDVIDAPMSGGPNDIAAGRITLFVGGPDDAVARVRPMLSCFADPVLRVGALGYGQRVKLVNNTLFAAQIGLLSEAVALGARLGVDEVVLLKGLRHGSAACRALDIVAAGGSVGAFVEARGEFLGKDVETARRTVAELAGDLGALDYLIPTAWSG